MVQKDRFPFKARSMEDWLAQVLEDRKGRPYAELAWQTEDGLVVPPLHVRQETDALPHLRQELAPLLRPERPWAIRELVQSASPEEAARQAKAALSRGADQLLLRFDCLGRKGLDPATLQARGPGGCPGGGDVFDLDAGSEGVPIYHVEDLARALSGLELAGQGLKLALDAGSASLPALAFLLAECRSRKLDPAVLRLELGVDPISELVSGTAPGHSSEQMLGEAASLFAWTKEHCPGVIPIAVRSEGFHRAGASAAQELACTLASGLQYVRCLLEKGHPLSHVLRSLSFRLQVSTDLYLEVAKLRAVRLLWAKIARACGASSAAELRLPIHCESSQRSQAADDVHGNLLRSTVQAFIATLGGCDSLTLAPFDPLEEQACSLARNQQLLLRDEAQLHRVADPAAGAYAFEFLTDQLARKAWSMFTEIEAAGGLLAALEAGWVQEQIGQVANARRQAFQTRRRSLVGINRYVDPTFEKGSRSEVDHQAIGAGLERWRAERDAGRVEQALEELSCDSFDSAIRAAEAFVTLGEMVGTLRGGEFLELSPPFYTFSPDGAGFESLRAQVRACSLKALLLVPDTDRRCQARADFAGDFFRAGGFEVVTASGPVDRSIGERGAQVLVLCADDESVPALVAEARREIAGGKVAGRKVALVVVGRVQEALESQVDAFICEGVNAYATLRQLFLETVGEES